MKRVVSSSILTLVVIALVVVAFFLFRHYFRSDNDALRFIPQDAVFFITIQPDQCRADLLLNNTIRNVFGRTPAFAALEEHLQLFDSLRNNHPPFDELVSGAPLILSAQISGASEFEFLWIRNLSGQVEDEEIDRLVTSMLSGNQVMEIRQYDGIEIREILDGPKNLFAYSLHKGIFLASPASLLVEDGLRQIKSGENHAFDFRELESESSKNGLSFYINFRNIPDFFSLFMDPSKQTTWEFPARFAAWSASTVTLREEAIVLNGFMVPGDSSDLVACLNGQSPVPQELPAMLPASTACFTLISMSNPQTFLSGLRNNFFTTEQQKKADQRITDIHDSFGIRVDEMMDSWLGSEYACIVMDPGTTNYDNHLFGILHAPDPEQALQVLQKISRSATMVNSASVTDTVYRSCALGEIPIDHLLETLYGSIFKRLVKTNYAIIDNYVVFANRQSSLKMFIDEVQAGNLLHHTTAFRKVRELLPGSGNWFGYVRPAPSLPLFRASASADYKAFSENYPEVFSGIKGLCWHLQSGPEKSRMTAVMGFSGADQPEGAGRLLTIETDTSVMMKPLLTTDPKSGNGQILFQDELNTLYLADNGGDILWKRAIRGAVAGSIYEMDLFRNNQRQFLFNTRDYLYLLDDNGRPVGNYPIRLPSPATNSVVLLDIDGRKDYKLYISCENKRVYAYRASGAPLPGWSMPVLPGVVERDVEKVMVNDSPCLLINDSEGGVYLVNPFGESAISVSEKFLITLRSVTGQEPNGTLVVTDRAGSIRKIGPGGQVQTIPLNAAGSEHGFVYADADHDGNADYIFIEGREVTAYNSALALIYRKEFDYPLTGEMSLFGTPENPLMAFRSKEADLNWLMKPDGTLLKDFPVQGGGSALVKSLNNDGVLNLITGGREPYLKVYSIGAIP